MFNYDRKQKFISSIESVALRNNFNSIFNQAEPFEEKFGVDLCEFDISGIQEFISSSGRKSTNGAESVALYIKQYSRWCIEQGYIDSVKWEYKRGNFDLTKAAKTYMVKNPLHLQTKLNEVFDKEKTETLDLVYRCYFWIAFSGIDYKDAGNIRVQDVNLMTRTINVKGVNYPIYEEALDTFKKCKELKCFMYSHTSKLGEEYTVERYRARGDLLLRGFKETDISRLKEVVSRRYGKTYKEGKTDCKLSYTRVLSSGYFYRTWQKDIAGVVDFRDEAQTYAEVRGLKDNIVTITRWYRKDYEVWKKALSD